MLPAAITLSPNCGGSFVVSSYGEEITPSSCGYKDGTQIPKWNKYVPRRLLDREYDTCPYFKVIVGIRVGTRIIDTKIAHTI